MTPLRFIAEKQLDRLSSNYKLALPMHDDTTRATFQLAELENFIALIKESKAFKDLAKKYGGADKIDGVMNHTVCVTFIREDLGNLTVYGEQHIATLAENAPAANEQPIKNKQFSQIIPLLTGCVREFIATDKEKSFQHIKDPKDQVIVLRPGGEGTGLIPPPRTSM